MSHLGKNICIECKFSYKSIESILIKYLNKSIQGFSISQKLLEKLCIEFYKNHINENVYVYFIFCNLPPTHDISYMSEKQN